MLSEKEFTVRIEQLPKIIYSKTRKASYTSFRLEGKILHFKRMVPKTDWDLDIGQLYKIYNSHNYMNTTVIKNITKGRVNSPSIAILMAMDCIDNYGNRI